MYDSVIDISQYKKWKNDETLVDAKLIDKIQNGEITIRLKVASMGKN